MCHQVGSQHLQKSVLTRQKIRGFEHPILHTTHNKIQQWRQRGGRYLETWSVLVDLRL